MRLTKIICTIGPACSTKEGIANLLRGGMNVARLNLSHGSLKDHDVTIKHLREASAEQGIPLPILIDTKGGEIRTVDRETPLEILEGEDVIFTAEKNANGKEKVIQVDHAGFLHDASQSKVILVDNGELVFDVLGTTKDGIKTKAQSKGKVGSRRHVNLPDVEVSLPTVTEKDWEDIEFACKENLDFIGLSFVRSANDVEEVREFLRKKKSNMKIVSKIECAPAVKRLEEIIMASDGVMVARGDLGAEIPFEKVPAVQNDIVAKARRFGKPVIVATHMLESMMHFPLPTRAEVTDIAHAAVTGTDCTMLSGETAKGDFPFKALETMHKVLVETEKAAQNLPLKYQEFPDAPPQAHAASAMAMAKELNAVAILVFTQSGGIAKAVSRQRPSMPVMCFTDQEEIARELQIYFGVMPFVVPFKNDDKMIDAAIELLKKRGIIHSGEHVVTISPAGEHDRSSRTVRSTLVP